jgi:hypothetical protein
VPITRGRAEGAGVAEREADGDDDGDDDGLESLVVGFSGAGSLPLSGSEPPHAARSNVEETIRVASRNTGRA